MFTVKRVLKYKCTIELPKSSHHSHYVDCIILFRFSEHQVVGALVCHFAGIGVLYILQASVNLVGSPAGCRVHDSQTLEGFNFGSYLQKRTEPAKQENITLDQ